MHLFWWAIVGLAAGVLAKALVPGTAREPKGCLMTMALGMAGGLLGGLLLGVLGLGNLLGPFSGLLAATLGAVLLILLFRRFWK